MSKPEEIPDTLYPDGNVPMPKAPGLATLPPASPRAVVSELQAIERCARGRGTPACDAIADRLAEVRAKLNEPYGISEELAGGGEAVENGPWRWHPSDPYVLCSDDFRRDARIEFSGDFADHDDVMRYKDWLLAKLNSALSAPPAQGFDAEVVSDEVFAKWAESRGYVMAESPDGRWLAPDTSHAHSGWVAALAAATKGVE